MASTIHTTTSIWTKPEIDPAERLAYDIATVSKMTGMCENTVRNRCKDGTFPHCKVGRRVLFPAELVHELLRMPRPEPTGCDVARATLDVVEMTRVLSISPRSLADWPDRYGFPSIKIGGRRLFPVDEAKAWLNDQASN